MLWLWEAIDKTDIVSLPRLETKVMAKDNASMSEVKYWHYIYIPGLVFLDHCKYMKNAIFDFFYFLVYGQ